MGRFVRGEIVVIPFPFSNLTATKRRPALVVADLPGDDVILCQITSQAAGNPFAISLTDQDFVTGGLQHPGTIRPERIFTADSHIILRSSGKVTDAKMKEVIAMIVKIVTS
jgi:mRNA-degrading endonuclease toxin of MazEF toxin-antitoxin module